MFSTFFYDSVHSSYPRSFSPLYVAFVGKIISLRLRLIYLQTERNRIKGFITPVPDSDDYILDWTRCHNAMRLESPDVEIKVICMWERCKLL